MTLTLFYQALLTLAKQCQSVSSQLSQKLQRLNDGCKTKKWKSIRQAFKTVWAREDIDALAERLRKYRDELQFHLIVSVRKRLDHVHLDEEQRFRQLNAEGQETIRKLIDKKCDVFETNLYSQTETLRNRHDLSDSRTGQGFREQTRHHLSAEKNARSRHEDIRQLLHEQEILADQRQEEILAAINDKRSKLSSRSIEQAVLSHLRFERMSDRQDEVAEQYQKTFEWVFADVQKGPQKWPNLMEWLENGDGCYWLHGKPGSGKSTLMKFVTEDDRTFAALKRWAPRTRSLLALEKWAPENGIITASFYFWRAGSYMQKSQAGLLQTLLYELLRQCPAIIPVVFPQLYEYESKSAAEGSIPSQSLTLAQLKKAFKRLANCSGSQFGICLFVDGLDEYIADQGTHDELARFFVDLCRSSKMKAILSSRPLGAFQDVLGDCPNLRLQDLTVDDIDFYVTDRINKHKRVIYLKDDDPGAVEELINEIKTKAEGVFLWVKLAVNTLLDGLQSYDSIDDLKDRLQELPGEVDELYMCMLERIPPRYRIEASKLLQLVTCFRSFGMGTLTTLAMSFAMEKDPLKAINTRVQKISEGEVINRGMILQGRLAAICSGFFEIHRPPVTEESEMAVDPNHAWVRLAKHTRRENSAPEIVQIEEFESWRRAEVEFLHRTAADFLGQRHIVNYLTNITSQGNFDPVKSLLRSCVFRVKTFPCEYVTSLPSGELGEVLLEAFLYASKLEAVTGRVQATLLDELDRSIAHHRQKLKHWDVMHDKNAAHCRRAEAHASFEHYEPFIGMAMRYGLHKYFKFKVSKAGLSECEGEARPLLFSALRDPCLRSNQRASRVPVKQQPPSLQLVKLILDAGADPNTSWHGLTAWAYACIIFFELSLEHNRGGATSESLNNYAHIMAVLIVAGADPNVLIEQRGIKSGTVGSLAMSPSSSIKLPREPHMKSDSESQDMGKRLIDLLERRGGQEHCVWLVPEKKASFDQSRKPDMYSSFEGLNSIWGEFRLFSDQKRQKNIFKNVRTVWQRKDEAPCVISSDWDFGVCDEASPQRFWERIFVP